MGYTVFGIDGIAPTLTAAITMNVTKWGIDIGA